MQLADTQPARYEGAQGIRVAYDDENTPRDFGWVTAAKAPSGKTGSQDTSAEAHSSDNPVSPYFVPTGVIGIAQGAFNTFEPQINHAARGIQGAARQYNEWAWRNTQGIPGLGGLTAVQAGASNFLADAAAGTADAATHASGHPWELLQNGRMLASLMDRQSLELAGRVSRGELTAGQLTDKAKQKILNLYQTAIGPAKAERGEDRDRGAGYAAAELASAYLSGRGLFRSPVKAGTPPKQGLAASSKVEPRPIKADGPAALTSIIKNTPLLERLQQQNPQAFRDFTVQSAEELGIAAGRLKSEGAETIAAKGYSGPFAPPISASEAAATDNLSGAAAKYGQGQKPAQPGFDISRGSDPAYVNRYVDGLYERAEAAAEELKGITQRIADQTGGTAGFRPGPKRRERVLEKVREYDGDASQLVGLAGSKITFNTLDDLYKALPAVERELGDKLIRVKDRIQHPVSSGYGDILMNVRMSNGHVAESRLHLKAVDDVAKIEHPLYQVQRSIEDMVRAERSDRTVDERALDISIHQRTHQLYENAFKASRR
jgi:hypothetical protein